MKFVLVRGINDFACGFKLDDLTISGDETTGADVDVGVPVVAALTGAALAPVGLLAATGDSELVNALVFVDIG